MNREFSDTAECPAGAVTNHGPRFADYGEG